MSHITRLNRQQESPPERQVQVTQPVPKPQVVRRSTKKIAAVGASAVAASAGLGLAAHYLAHWF